MRHGTNRSADYQRRSRTQTWARSLCPLVAATASPRKLQIDLPWKAGTRAPHLNASSVRYETYNYRAPRREEPALRPRRGVTERPLLDACASVAVGIITFGFVSASDTTVPVACQRDSRMGVYGKVRIAGGLRRSCSFTRT